MRYKELFKGAKKFFVRNATTIFTVISVGGVITTTVFAIKDTPKAMILLEEKRREKGEELTLLETAQAAWKCYVRTAAMGTLTIVCILSGQKINNKRNAALASAYSITSKALKEYETKVIETIGDKKERRIKDDIMKDKIKSNPLSKNEVIATGNGDTLCYDTLSGRYFKSDIEKVKQVCNTLSRNLLIDGYVFLNDFYHFLGLEQIPLGDDLGWDVDTGLIEPFFSSQLAEDGSPCLVIDIRIEPTHMDFN